MSGTRRFSAAAALATAVVAVSWSAILVRLCEAPSLGIAFYRVFLSCVVLLPWAVRGGPRVSGATYAAAVLAGVLLGAHFATWISSLAYTSVASSVVLVSTAPVFTAVLSPLMLRERPGAGGWTAVALTLAGTAVLAGGDWRLGGDALLGDALALAGALTASLYLMIGRGLRERIGFVRYLVVVYGAAAASLVVVAAPAGAPLSGYPRSTWIWLVLIAAGPNLTGHSLLNWSVRRLRALTVNLAVLGEPLLATAYAAVLFGEIPRGAFWAGGALILAGVALAVVEESRSSAAPAPPPPSP